MPLLSSRSITTVGLCLMVASGGLLPTVTGAGLPHPPSARVIHVPLRCDWTPEEPPLQLAAPLRLAPSLAAPQRAAPPLALPSLAAPTRAIPTFPTTTVSPDVRVLEETPGISTPGATESTSGLGDHGDGAPDAVTESEAETQQAAPDALSSPLASEPPLPTTVPLPMTTVERERDAATEETGVSSTEPVLRVPHSGPAELRAESTSGPEAIAAEADVGPPDGPARAPALKDEMPDASRRAVRSFPAQQLEAPVDRLALADSLFAAGESAIALDVYSAIDLETVAPASRSWVLLQIAACYRRAGQTEEALRRYRELVTTTDPAWVSELARWWIRAVDTDRTRSQDVENLGTAVQQLQEAVAHELQ